MTKKHRGDTYFYAQAQSNQMFSKKNLRFQKFIVILWQIFDRNNRDMKEELTTLMHMEFCKDEWEAMELRVMEVSVVADRGGDVDAALKAMGLTREEYNQNVDAVFNLTECGIDPKNYFI